VLGAVALAACNGREQGAAQPEAPAPVVLGPEDVVRVEPQVLQSGPQLSGTLQPRRAATVRAEVSGAVLEMAVEQGQEVRRGQLLARLEDATLRDQLLAARTAAQVAEGALEVAQAEEARMRKLADAGVITRRDFERAELARRQAEAQLSEAQARRALAMDQLGRARVSAPFAGVVSERHASAGDIVQPGAPLYTVVDPSSLRLEASVPAAQLEALQPGVEVDFSVSGYGSNTFKGRIERINPAVDPSTGQVRLYVTLPNLEQALLAGLFAQGRVAAMQREVLAAPVSAVEVRGEPPTVLRVRQGRVERVPVALGLRDEVVGRVELRSGVQQGDLLLRGTARELPEGTPVTVQAPARPEPQSEPAVGGAGTSPAPEEKPSSARPR
jgi:RND family efflux transporter MFP subunit